MTTIYDRSKVFILNEKLVAAFLTDMSGLDVFVDCVMYSSTKHAADNEALVIFIKVPSTDKTYVANIDHGDAMTMGINSVEFINNLVINAKRTFVMDKKRFVHLFKNTNVFDILIYDSQFEIVKRDDLEFLTSYHEFINNRMGEFSESNYVIPLAKHLERFETLYRYFKESILEFSNDFAYNKLNGLVTETLGIIEANGLYVDKDILRGFFPDKNIEINNSKVYTEYNIFTVTGRPSNRFGKINYAAINKDDGSRKAFISRFGRDGRLMTIDYKAYHPHIIAELTGYKFALDVDVYRYLGQFYFNESELNSEDIANSKTITFQNLYGGIKDEYKQIDYYKRVSAYIDQQWKFFCEYGCVETPIFKRKITKNHIIDPNPNKLFNYILQALETEHSMCNVKLVNDYLQLKKSKVVLYTYDAILVDVCKDDGLETLIGIKNLMINNLFPVKCSMGTNYNNLREISL